VTAVLTHEQRTSWLERGFFRIAGFAPPKTCAAMLARVTEVVRDPDLAAELGVKVVPESNEAELLVENPEDGVSRIFKLHSFYFPFEPAWPVVGVRLAVTEATLVNGCLHVLPGSQTEPVHAHVPDRRPRANYGYFEIVDHDMGDAEPVLMDPGDLLVFDSHLLHCSTDNESAGIRAAMVYHYAAAGTTDHSEEYFPSVNDWVPARRDGRPTASTASVTA
jgi:ectoine hydroxylase-related dioxygenase (phytanoyl-CoA dioxygenase family)